MATYSAVRDDALGNHDLVGLLEELHTRRVSGAELAAAALERAHDSQDALNAVVSWVDAPTPANDTGAFAGIPTFLKDNENLAGSPTRDGSRATSARPATSTSPVGSVLADLGVTFLGKSSLPEFGLTGTTEPLLNGPTHNPWALDRSAGGSSGGAAALVAAGVVPFAHANDGGGSIRIPAACCGLVGLKPSRGRLPNGADSEQLPIQIVSQGVLTRTVRDTALIFAEAEKHYRAPGTLAPIGHVTGPSPQRLRIGIVRDGLTGPVAPQIAAAVSNVAELCSNLGHEVVESDLGVYPKFGRDFLRYWAALAYALMRGGSRLYGPEFDRSQLEPFTIGLGEYFAKLALAVPASLARLRRLPARYAKVYEAFDVMIMPTLGTMPPELGYLSPALDFHTHAARLLPFAGFTAVQNVTGTPALALPMGLSEGVPLGIQLAGAFGAERTLLELAYELEEAAPWPLTPSAD